MMGIFYCLVARGNVVLAESSAAATATNASSLARQVLEKTLQAAKDNSNASYSHDRCIFHVKRTDGLTVLCMADDAFGRNYYYLLFFFLLSRFLFLLDICGKRWFDLGTFSDSPLETLKSVNWVIQTFGYLSVSKGVTINPPPFV